MRQSDALFGTCQLSFPSTMWRGRVIRVIDGDTVVVLVDLGWFRAEPMEIRFASASAWEPRITPTQTPEQTALGKRASARMTELAVPGMEVFIRTKMDTEKYGRILGDISLNGVVNLSDVLRDEGLAKP